MTSLVNLCMLFSHCSVWSSTAGVEVRWGGGVHNRGSSAAISSGLNSWIVIISPGLNSWMVIISPGCYSWIVIISYGLNSWIVIISPGCYSWIVIISYGLNSWIVIISFVCYSWMVIRQVDGHKWQWSSSVKAPIIYIWIMLSFRSVCASTI